MKIQEQIDTFGVAAIKVTIEDMLRSYQCDLEWFATENEYIFKEYLANNEKELDWIFNLRMQSNKTAENKLRKLIRKWEMKAKIVNGELKENQILIDLDTIKAIPISQFLGEPTLRGHQKDHYKAPWRPEEKQGSLVVFHDNRFYDFGDGEKRGSVIDFIMLTEGLEFKEAVNWLKNYL